MTPRLTLPRTPAPLPAGSWLLIEGPARLEWHAGTPPVRIAASQAAAGTVIHAHPALHVSGPATVVPHSDPPDDYPWLVSALLSLLAPGPASTVPDALPSVSLAPLLNATDAARRSAAREHQALRDLLSMHESLKPGRLPAPPAGFAFRHEAFPSHPLGFTGDFVTAVNAPTGYWLAIGDAAGHGIAPAWFGQLAARLIHQALLQSHGPTPVDTIDQTLEAARAALPRNPAHHYATLTLLRIAAPNGDSRPPIIWSTIGHRHPVFSRAIRPTILRAAAARRPSGIALGLPGFSPPPVYAAPAPSQLSLLLATDGVTDALTARQLQRLLAGGADLPLRTLTSRILRLARLLHPTDQDPDDRSVLLLRTT